jgi:glutamate/tyrosine decarboxylase-like PLP-dependent enzyme
VFYKGTTVYGAIDNVEEIIKVCERYNLWCHVDGMFGGFAIMSDTFREKYKGVERYVT